MVASWSIADLDIGSPPAVVACVHRGADVGGDPTKTHIPIRMLRPEKAHSIRG